ncbi:MAG: NAC family transcription factor [Methanospirillum sp.]
MRTTAKEDEGVYCTICGGMVTQAPGVRRIPIDGIDTGIAGLDECIAAVKMLGLSDDGAISEELVSRIGKGTYIPTRKREAYAAAFLAEYKRVE